MKSTNHATITPKKITVFPDAGLENPCQYLMVDYWRSQGHTVHICGPLYPEHKWKPFRFIRSTRETNPEIVYFDWVHDLLLGETTRVSLWKSIHFTLSVFYVKYILRKKIVHTLHNIHNHAKKHIKIERFFHRIFLKQCDIVRVYTESTIPKANAYFNITISRYVVAPDVPYTFYYDTEITQTEARKRLNIPEDKFVYLFLGHIKPYKGVEDLIDNFSSEDFRDDHLILAGRPATETYGELIREKIAGRKNIHLFGEYIKKEDVKYYMGAADVVVLPFRNIEHSGSIELAMTFGKAVITVKAPSINDFLHQQSELLYNEQQELQEKMLAAKKMDTQTIGKKNHEIAHNIDYHKLNLLLE